MLTPERRAADRLQTQAGPELQERRPPHVLRLLGVDRVPEPAAGLRARQRHGRDLLPDGSARHAVRGLRGLHGLRLRQADLPRCDILRRQ